MGFGDGLFCDGEEGMNDGVRAVRWKIDGLRYPCLFLVLYSWIG